MLHQKCKILRTAQVRFPQEHFIRRMDSHKPIKNKQKRQEVYTKLKRQKITVSKQRKRLRAMEVERLGQDTPKQKPKTLETERTHDETTVNPQDEEIKASESIDEFAEYYIDKIPPKICITTGRKVTPRVYSFIEDLLKSFPNSFFYKRRDFNIKDIVEQAQEKQFTDLIVINEDQKDINGLLLIHLPKGPTAYFKLTNLKLSSEIPGRGAMTPHKPELVLNRFTTRLGRRVGRMLGALVDHQPDFKGRRVLTFHNQRDFIFFRQHRYIFDDGAARIQELGPQFTLKLKSLQKGTFDSAHGEYEWKDEFQKQDSRRSFFM